MTTSSTPGRSSVVHRLAENRPLVTVELRPPRSGMSYGASVDAWIDMYHSIRRLARQDTLIFLTDNAVGLAEEENLAHLTANLAGELAPARIIPFLTAKHSLEYIQLYATRAASHGFEALTVVGGDQSAGPPRCLPHAYQLRRWIRERVPSMDLGGWVNPLKDPVRQVDFLLDREFAAEFYLTQIVSHHSVAQVERFLAEARRRGVSYPGVFGVFLYRSANPRTLRQLASFLPVPAEEITGEFAAGLSPEEICARSIRALRAIGVDKVYVSNLGFDRPDARYRRILELV
jgi:5,10-methylenetetrahydrofolate reductase